MYTLIVQTEEECKPLTEIEKEEAAVLTISQKDSIQSVKGLETIQVCNKKRRRIQRCKRGSISRQRRNRE